MAGDKLVSMKLTKAETEKENEVSEDRPEFPFGLTLRLDNEALDKLGMKEMPEVGTDIELAAKVVVTEVSEHTRGDGDTVKGLSLQITDMNLFKRESPTKTADKIYGG